MTTLPPVVKTRGMSQIEYNWFQRTGEIKDIRDILRDLLNENRSIYWIADHLRVSHQAIKNWIGILGIVPNE